MTNLVPLNNVVHKDLKVITEYSQRFGNNVNYVLTFPTEYADIQLEYPIFFQKHPETGKFQSVALLGIAPEENLFLEDNHWNASYVPGIVDRGPFLIGFEDQSANGGDEHTPVILVDMDDARVSKTEGENVFLEFGGNSRYLEKVTSILNGIYQGNSVSDMMFDTYSKLGLIEPVKLEITLNNGEIHNLHGNYTISREKLLSLTGDELVQLNQQGLLEGAFLVLASINNVKKLIQIKNSKI